jgi:hypothetical protein
MLHLSWGSSSPSLIEKSCSTSDSQFHYCCLLKVPRGRLLPPQQLWMEPQRPNFRPAMSAGTESPSAAVQASVYDKPSRHSSMSVILSSDLEAGKSEGHIRLDPEKHHSVRGSSKWPRGRDKTRKERNRDTSEQRAILRWQSEDPFEASGHEMLYAKSAQYDELQLLEAMSGTPQGSDVSTNMSSHRYCSVHSYLRRAHCCCDEYLLT